MAFTSMALMAVLAMGQNSTEMRLMRYPDVHGDKVVFSYAGDIWMTTLDGGSATRLTTHPGIESRPKFSPDGKLIAFTGQYEGGQDVYVVSTEGGQPKRLTYGAAPVVTTGWTPDGRVAYVTASDSFSGRQLSLWTVSPRGGLPRATPVHEAYEVSYSPDGSEIAYTRVPSQGASWRRYRGGNQAYVSFFDLKHTGYWELPHGREQQWSPMWVGHEVYYASDKDGTTNLYSYDLDSKATKELTHYTDADVKYPSTDGHTIVFERDGYVYAYDIASAKESKLTPYVAGDMPSARPTLKKLAPWTDSLTLSPSGVRVALTARGFMFSVPAHTGETRNMTTTQGRETNPRWSPDGKTIAFVSDAGGETQIYVRPQMGGPATKLTTNEGPSITELDWTPDGKSLMYRNAAHDLMLLDVTSKKSTLVAKATYGDNIPYDISPDNKWIAYLLQGDNLFTSLYLYEVATGKATKVTEGYYNDDDVAFDLDGKYLYLISSRSFTPAGGAFEVDALPAPPQRVYLITLTKDERSPLLPKPDEEGGGGQAPEAAPEPPKAAPAGDGKKPAADDSKSIKIDFDGLGDRIVPLPLPVDSYEGIVGGRDGVFILNDGSLSFFSLKSRRADSIVSGIGGFAMNASRTKIAYAGPGGVYIVDASPGQAPGAGHVNLNDVEAVIDPHSEWSQEFWEAWRYERDHFYDPNMRGLNWKEIGDHYAKYLPYVEHRAELSYLLGLMIGELGTSHSYVIGGDAGASIPQIPVGSLGADYQPDGDWIKFAKVYRGESFDESRRGPLGDPGVNVNEGDYLLEIDGNPVRSWTNPSSFLLDKVGHSVTLLVNSKPSYDGARKVVVRPIGNEEQLRYIDWVEGNRKLVGQLTNGQVGYMHVPNTSSEGLTEFMKGFFSQTDKKALIVDERWNGGGMLPTFFIEKLSRTVAGMAVVRNAKDFRFPLAIGGPKVMLINGYAGSGGDLFPWLFRHAKLGPLIGARTWGGLVGIMGGARLADGGEVTAPEFGIYDPEAGKWIAENEGLWPDVAVDYRPDLVAQGQDPQLQEAIKYLMDELKKNPPQEPLRPTVKPIDRTGGPR